MDQLVKYFKDTAGEMKQVAWPTQQQALVYSALVIGISALVALYAGAFDYLFSQFISYVVDTF